LGNAFTVAVDDSNEGTFIGEEVGGGAPDT
jgi:hypothetical protein